MLKRGQIDSHVLVYVLAIVIVAVILVMGYRFISQGGKMMDKSELLIFKNKLEYDIKTVGREVGSFKKITYSLPKNVEEVCFVDLNKKSPLLSSRIIDMYPIIKDSIKDSDQNVFFVGTSDKQSFSIPSIAVKHYPYMSCFYGKSGKVDIGIEGLGGGNSSILADFVTKVKISPSQDVVLQSADQVMTIKIPKGVTAPTNYITIEMSEPLSVGPGASDVYQFGPPGTKFSGPISLAVKYDPKAAGDCPATLVFSQFDQEGGSKISFQSKSVDCENKIAYFEIDRFV